jgi:hypothetical protein
VQCRTAVVAVQAISLSFFSVSAPLLLRSVLFFLLSAFPFLFGRLEVRIRSWMVADALKKELDLRHREVVLFLIASNAVAVGGEVGLLAVGVK